MYENDLARARAQAHDWVQERLAFEREQLRLAKEQQARTKALEKRTAIVEREQERQAAILANHEKRISDLEFKMEEAQNDIENWKEELGQYFALLDIAELNLAGTLNGSKEQEKYQRKVITLNKQIHATEKRIRKAQHTIKTTERELATA